MLALAEIKQFVWMALGWENRKKKRHDEDLRVLCSILVYGVCMFWVCHDGKSGPGFEISVSLHVVFLTGCNNPFCWIDVQAMKFSMYIES